MTDLELVGALMAGLVTPLITAVIQRPTWPRELRFMVGLAVAVAAAFFVWLFQNSLDLSDWGWRDYIKVFGALFISQYSSYMLVWKDTLAGKIEEATTPAAAQ